MLREREKKGRRDGDGETQHSAETPGYSLKLLSFSVSVVS